MRVAICGCAGRMGQALVRGVNDATDMALAAASEAPTSPALGQDAGSVCGLPPLGVQVTADAGALAAEADVVIDFSTPQVGLELAQACRAPGTALVIGTTGFSAEQREQLQQAAKALPLVLAPNMSVGVNVLLRLVAEAARLLGPDYDAEIVELHHGRKLDAPSGTALRLAEVLAAATADSGPLEQRGCYGRQGQVGQRPAGEIGVHAVRAGDVVGEHTVYLCGTGERLELIHRASSRETFAQGGLRAARWAVGRSPGFYDMQDVLGLR